MPSWPSAHNGPSIKCQRGTIYPLLPAGSPKAPHLGVGPRSDGSGLDPKEVAPVAAALAALISGHHDILNLLGFLALPGLPAVCR